MDLFTDISAFDTGRADWRGSELPLDFMILKEVPVLPRPLDNLETRQGAKANTVRLERKHSREAIIIIEGRKTGCRDDVKLFG